MHNHELTSKCAHMLTCDNSLSSDTMMDTHLSGIVAKSMITCVVVIQLRWPVIKLILWWTGEIDGLRERVHSWSSLIRVRWKPSRQASHWTCALANRKLCTATAIDGTWRAVMTLSLDSQRTNIITKQMNHPQNWHLPGLGRSTNQHFHYRKSRKRRKQTKTPSKTDQTNNFPPLSNRPRKKIDVNPINSKPYISWFRLPGATSS